MATHASRPKRDESSALESGTVRDKTSGNQPAKPQQRPGTMKPKQEKKTEGGRQTGGDPSVAGEER